MMAQSADFRSGKDHRDENFPVASRLVSARHRPAIMAFYDFARAADDIADHPTLPAADKLRGLDRMERTLTGANSDDVLSVRLREQIAERRLSPQHGLDLLKAFRQDVTKNRYADWDDLIGYCTYSAMPVGRFVLDVHGEDRATWASSDVLCAVLQIVNHLQDCGKDYRALDRVYLPQDILRSHGATTEMLAAPKSSPALLACLHDLARRTVAYFETQPPLTDEIRDTRLACEVAAISALAQRILGLLQNADPLADKVHLSRATLVGVMAGSVAKTVARRLLPRSTPVRRAQDLRP
jgi:squalene synthase HpnC